MAAGTTAALGYAGGIWFERGERLDPEALRRIASVTSSTMIDRMKNLGRRRPGEATLRERVVEVLDEMKESEAVATDAAEPNQESG